MTRCPSQDWDRHVAEANLPEVCPVCGAQNANDEGSPIYAADIGFCSNACSTRYRMERDAEDQALYDALIESYAGGDRE